MFSESHRRDVDNYLVGARYFVHGCPAQSNSGGQCLVNPTAEMSTTTWWVPVILFMRVNNFSLEDTDASLVTLPDFCMVIGGHSHGTLASRRGFGVVRMYNFYLLKLPPSFLSVIGQQHEGSKYKHPLPYTTILLF